MWWEILIKRAANILTVKSLVTLALTVAFIIQTCRGELNRDMMTIFSMVITFYFVNQTQKAAGGGGEE